LQTAEVLRSGERTVEQDDQRDAPKVTRTGRSGDQSGTVPEPDSDLRELMRGVPKARIELLTDLIGLLDAFCGRHLDDEYKALCRKLAWPKRRSTAMMN
jgi:hypothetical protein